jgi:threonine/homoserine/homoserine lactone efflux protein
MFVLVQFGFDHVFARFPWLFAGLTVGSLIYVAWLAIKVFRLGLVEDEQVSRRPRPMTFVEAVLFQWINGKAWQIVLMAATLYATPKTSVRLWSGLIFIIFLIITGSFWVELGAHISGLLKNPKTRFAYYSALALALIISTFPSGISMLRTLAH